MWMLPWATQRLKELKGIQDKNSVAWFFIDTLIFFVTYLSDESDLNEVVFEFLYVSYIY